MIKGFRGLGVYGLVLIKFTLRLEEAEDVKETYASPAPVCFGMVLGDYNYGLQGI